MMIFNIQLTLAAQAHEYLRIAQDGRTIDETIAEALKREAERIVLQKQLELLRAHDEASTQ